MGQVCDLHGTLCCPTSRQMPVTSVTMTAPFAESLGAAGCLARPWAPQLSLEEATAVSPGSHMREAPAQHTAVPQVPLCTLSPVCAEASVTPWADTETTGCHSREGAVKKGFRVSKSAQPWEILEGLLGCGGNEVAGARAGSLQGCAPRNGLN